MSINTADATPAEPPPYRFTSDELPAALAPLRERSQWVAWGYELKGGRWTKPPRDPRTGRYASVDNPATWGTFDVALDGMERHGLAGVGIVLTADDNLTGIDLDDVINDAGHYSPLAAELLNYGETYAEISPSGAGVRLLALGKVSNASKDDRAGIEVYGSGRYLTITGNQIEGAPNEIKPAPRTIARLCEAVAASKPNGSKSQSTANPRGDDVERIRDALRVIPADDREVWLRVGMGLKCELGDAGFGLWREWSMSSIKFDEPDTRRVWLSLKPEGGVTIATVFGLAHDHGWRETRRALTDASKPKARAERKQEKLTEITDANVEALQEAAAQMRGSKYAPIGSD